MLFSVLDDPRLRVGGLAIAHAASYLVAASAGLVLLRRRAGDFDAGPLGETLIKTIPAAALGGAAAWATARLVESAFGVDTLVTQLLQVLVAMTTGLAAYLGVAKLWGLEELQWMRSVILRRGPEAR